MAPILLKAGISLLIFAIITVPYAFYQVQVNKDNAPMIEKI
jgi:hypothetical protein